MSADVVVKAVVVGGAALLCLGPALQSYAEIREYRDLLDTAEETDLAGVTRDYLHLSRELLLPKLPGRGWKRWLVLAFLFPIVGLTSLWPPLALRRIKAILALYRRYVAALDAFSAAASGDNMRAAQVRTQLSKARNWGIVLAGSSLILVAASVDLISALSKN